MVELVAQTEANPGASVLCFKKSFWFARDSVYEDAASFFAHLSDFVV